MSNDKWLMFKNYMHNELQITKEDIRKWIEEAVKAEASKILKQSFSSFDIDKHIRDLTNDKFYKQHINRQVIEKVSELISKRIKIINE
jgi:hypothetical protein